MTPSKDTIIRMTCKPFSAYGRGEYRLLVQPDGAVLVFDDIAGHYTACHSLPQTSISAARRKAARA